MLLATIPFTTAVTAQVTAPVSPISFSNGLYESAVLQANFTYGSGGTTVSAYVQTTFDGGVTWVDAANFGFTTSSAIKIFNLSGLTSVVSPVTPTDGSLTANTAVAWAMGPQWRMKYTSTGTYAGNTSLRIDLAPRGLLG